MLVDFDPGPPDPGISRIARGLGESPGLTRVDRGLYVGSINAGNLYARVIRDDYPFDPRPISGESAAAEAGLRVSPESGGLSAEDREVLLERLRSERRARWDEYVKRVEADGWPDASYGVSDSLEQVVERYPCLESDPRRLVVIGSEIRRADQPADGGWRWHKWGPYIGDREPRYEYLHDEPDIESVWVWHVYEIGEERDG